MRRSALLIWFALAALGPVPARAIDLNDGQLNVHGDGWWSYERTSNANRLGDANGAGNYDSARFDLVLRVKPADDLALAAQIGFDPTGVAAQYVFADLRLADWLRLKVGKVPQPYGNLNDLRYAGTTRVFFHMPVSVYGPTGFAGTTYLGAGLYAQRFTDDGWSFGAEAYGGAVDIEDLEGYRGLIGAGSTQVPALEERQVRDAVGGRLWASAPGNLIGRLSGYAGRLGRDDGAPDRPFRSIALSFHHPGERFRLGVEAAYQSEDGRQHALAGYAFATWKVLPKIQVALRYERIQSWLTGVGSTSPLLRHEAIGLVTNYWFSTGLVFKAEYQIIDGNRLAFPDLPSDVLASTPIPRRTGVFVGGMQFTF
jgi:hypothetical protein